MEKEKLSRVPSWIMLGFVLGAIAAHTLAPRIESFWQERKQTSDAALTPKPTPASEATPAPTPTPKPPPSGATLEEVEAIFSLYRRDAVWDRDRTEIAIWNKYTEHFSDFFELFRDEEGKIWYRSIPALTRPVIQYEGEEGRPIRFTESEWSRNRRMEQIPLLLRPPPPKL